MPDPTLLGRMLWYELLTTDMKGAETFYSAVVGWRAAPSEGSPQPMTSGCVTAT
jgi:predicted enzyme related to lactoylglutathione lyase